jgi:hypothetical protein
MMMLDREYLQRLLMPLRFEVAWFSSTAKQVVFSRLCQSNSDIYERINIHCGGKKGESIPARIELSVTKGRPNVLTESSLLTELANNDRGTFVAKSPQETRQWAHRLASIVNDRLETLSREKSDHILKTTASIRNAAILYLNKIAAFNCSASELIILFEKKAETKGDFARKISQWPGVIQIPNAESIYYLVCLTILIFSKEIEPYSDYLKKSDPLDFELLGRIQLIVDYLTSNRNSPIPTPWNLKGGS